MQNKSFGVQVCIACTDASVDRRFLLSWGPCHATPRHPSEETSCSVQCGCGMQMQLPPAAAAQPGPSCQALAARGARASLAALVACECVTPQLSSRSIFRLGLALLSVFVVVDSSSLSHVPAELDPRVPPHACKEMRADRRFRDPEIKRLFSSPILPKFHYKKEDSPSHQNVGNCMEY
jgi:hypothetical protein